MTEIERDADPGQQCQSCAAGQQRSCGTPQYTNIYRLHRHFEQRACLQPSGASIINRREISHTCRAFSSRACPNYAPLRPASVAAGEWLPAKANRQAGVLWGVDGERRADTSEQVVLVEWLAQVTNDPIP